MGKTKGELWIVDNMGFSDGPFKTELAARTRLMQNVKEGFAYKRNCCLVRILGNYDNYCAGDMRYTTSTGLPKSNEKEMSKIHLKEHKFA